ncbi:MAG TPA: nuclear transport factor 2 family protein [Thermomonospora sp.]|nr:nuclear transport factor 2 family protein [Thermomonospora sp.]
MTVGTTTEEVIEEYLRRSGEGDPDRIAALYAEAVGWRVNWPVDDHPAVPWIRPRSTRADVADHYRTFGRLCEGTVTLDRVLYDGPHAVLIGESVQTVRTTGRTFTMRFALHLTVRDGLIVQHHMYEDSQAVLEAFVPAG